MDDEARWQAVLSRDPGGDGRFVYAVLSTGVFCRPSCPSRRPGRERTLFFDLPELAESAGFRPCRRCRPQDAPADHRLEKVRRAIRFIEMRIGEPPTLAELGAQVELSPHHLQRVFKKAVQVTPRQYMDVRRLGRLKEMLRGGNSLAGSIYEAGYGSPSRLYERAGAQLGMTPAAYRRGGEGAEIGYAVVGCSLGRLLVAATRRGVCAVKLGDSDAALEADIQAEFPAALLRRDDGGLKGTLKIVLNHLEGEMPHPGLPLDVRATAFQRRVWEYLRTIPAGQTATYGEVAESLGLEKGARAVARACASNPAALLVPCHRVVRADGGLGGYRWGVKRKRALLERECARVRKKRG